jgi:hypothetical protein
VYYVIQTHAFSNVPLLTRTNKKNPILNYNKRRRGLSLTAPAKKEKDNEWMPGNVLAQRSIYRLAHLVRNKSTIQEPYSIEERQYFIISEDSTLEPLGKRSVILRGGGDDEHQGKYTVNSHWSWRTEEEEEDNENRNGIEEKAKRARVHTRIGPVLYTIDDLIDEEGSNTGGMGGSIWDKYYVMALYCIQHPDIISGTGLEIGR